MIKKKKYIAKDGKELATIDSLRLKSNNSDKSPIRINEQESHINPSPVYSPYEKKNHEYLRNKMYQQEQEERDNREFAGKLKNSSDFAEKILIAGDIANSQISGVKTLGSMFKKDLPYSGGFPISTIKKNVGKTGKATLTEVPELTKEQQILQNYGLDINKTKIPDDAIARTKWGERKKGRENTSSTFVTKNPNGKGESFNSDKDIYDYLNVFGDNIKDNTISKTNKDIYYPHNFTDFGPKTPYQRMYEDKGNFFPDDLRPKNMQKNKYGGKLKRKADQGAVLKKPGFFNQDPNDPNSTMVGGENSQGYFQQHPVDINVANPLQGNNWNPKGGINTNELFSGALAGVASLLPNTPINSNNNRLTESYNPYSSGTGSHASFEDGGIIAKSGFKINPKHKGYCTPMTKATCTGKRRTFALNAKKHFKKGEDGLEITPDQRNNWNDFINYSKQQPGYGGEQMNHNSEQGQNILSGYNSMYPNKAINPNMVQSFQQDFQNIQNGSNNIFGSAGSRATKRIPGGVSKVDNYIGTKTSAQQYPNVEYEHQDSRGNVLANKKYGADFGLANKENINGGWFDDKQPQAIPQQTSNLEKPIVTGENYKKPDNSQYIANRKKRESDKTGKYDNMYMRNGGTIENISETGSPHDIVEFHGPSHENGGIPLSYNGKQVEVEGKESGFMGHDGSYNIMGNMKVPGSSSKFKDVFKEIAKVEKKNAKKEQIGTDLINNNDPKKAYQGLSFNTGKVLHDATIQTQMHLDQHKEKLANLQNAILDFAEKTDMEPKVVAKMYGGKAKYGMKIAKDGDKVTSSNMFDHKYDEVINKSKKYLQDMYPGHDVDIYQASGDRDITTQAKKKKTGASQTTVSLHNAGAARDYHIYVDGKLIDNKNHEAYKKSIWRAADESGLYHLNDAKPSKEGPTPFGNTDPYHISMVRESNDHTGYKRLMEQYPQVMETPLFKKTEKYISKSKDPIAKIVYQQMQEARSKKHYFGGNIAKDGITMDGDDPETNTTDKGYHYKKNYFKDFTPDGGPTSTQIDRVPVRGYNPSPDSDQAAGLEIMPVPNTDQLKENLNNQTPGEYKQVPNYIPTLEEKPEKFNKFRNRVGIGDVLPEISELFDQPRSVSRQEFNPQLYSPYQVSFEDRIAGNQGDFNAIQRASSHNPATLGALAAQKYNSDNQVRGEEFRTNQGISDRVENQNIQLLNSVREQNLQEGDKQFVRQEQAYENTKANRNSAMVSIADKIAKNRASNAEIKMYEDWKQFAYDPKNGFRHQGEDTQIIDPTVNIADVTPANKSKVKKYRRDVEGNVMEEDQMMYGGKVAERKSYVKTNKKKKQMSF